MNDSDFKEVILDMLRKMKREPHNKGEYMIIERIYHNVEIIGLLIKNKEKKDG